LERGTEEEEEEEEEEEDVVFKALISARNGALTKTRRVDGESAAPQTTSTGRWARLAYPSIPVHYDAARSIPHQP
jgi:hypothetical protein